MINKETNTYNYSNDMTTPIASIFSIFSQIIFRKYLVMILGKIRFRVRSFTLILHFLITNLYHIQLIYSILYNSLTLISKRYLFIIKLYNFSPTVDFIVNCINFLNFCTIIKKLGLLKHDYLHNSLDRNKNSWSNL